MAIRVRYAPSPTGFLHIGNARTALFNYLFAKHYEGKFIVRIEDTDSARNVETGIESQLNYLKWLGLDWDESIDQAGEVGPYQQMERLAIYKRYAVMLEEQGVLYRSYCTKDTLDELKAQGASKEALRQACQETDDEEAPYALRFRVPEGVTYRFKDLVKGTIQFASEDVEDWVAIKQNGIPTYNFACAIDDYLMKISHVLRGEDHITNTPKQLMVFDAFGWPYPIYAHMTLIVNSEGKKLSKRDGSILQFIEQYKDLGYLPEALFNFIGLLGFSPAGEEEILSKDAFIQAFDAERLSTSPATFDPQKLTYINRRYIQTLDIEGLKTLCLPHLEKAGIGADQPTSWFESLLAVFQERLEFGSQIVEHYHHFFDQPFVIEGDVLEFLESNPVRDVIETFYRHIEALDVFEPDTIKGAVTQSGKTAGVKGKGLFMPLRIAVSAAMHGPELPKMMHLMGQELVLERLQETLKLLK